MCHKPWETTQSVIRVQQSQTGSAEFSTQTLSVPQERTESQMQEERDSEHKWPGSHPLLLETTAGPTRKRITGTPTLCCWAGGVLFRPRSHEITGRMLRVCRPGDLWSQCWFSHSLIMRRRAVQWCSLIVWWITLISALPADTLHSDKSHYLT